MTFIWRLMNDYDFAEIFLIYNLQELDCIYNWLFIVGLLTG